MGAEPNLAKLHAETERSRYDFLQTDLALCFTFADLVNTELGLALRGDRAAG